MSGRRIWTSEYEWVALDGRSQELNGHQIFAAEDKVAVADEIGWHISWSRFSGELRII